MNTKLFFSLILFIVLFVPSFVAAQTTEFTYQGRLDDSAGTAASYDFEFRLFSVETGDAALATNQRLGVAVSNGVFTVKLDFGANFNGQPRWLEIAVKPAGSANPLTVLTPRQSVSSAPYSIRSLNSTTADTSTNSAQLGGVAANQFIQTTDTRLSDARNPLPGSGSYIQNTTTPQTASNFNIAGDGTAGGTLSGNAVNSATQYNIGGSRVLATSSFFGKFFAGIGAGGSPTSGGSNSFFGNQAGQSNTAGANNSFFGKSAGNSNTGGGNNSFFGEQSGFGTSTGNFNSFFGQFSGRNNQTGGDNAFFGYRAGANNTASGNSFFGSGAGDSVTTGQFNAFFGRSAGAAVITGLQNSFFGYNAGLVNTANRNSFFGAFAGDANTTGAKNSFFGNAAGTTNVSGNDNSFFGDNAGLVNTANGNSFFGSGVGDSNTLGNLNSFFGAIAGSANSTGSSNSFFGTNAGDENTTGCCNSFFGQNAGDGNRTGTRNSHFGYLSFSLSGNDDNNDNAFFGYDAGQSMIGDENTVVGSGAGNGGGNSNTFVGFEAGDASLGANSTGRNTAIGATSVANGGTSTAIGFNARAVGGFSTAIGANAVATSNVIKLGTSSNTVVIDGKLVVDILGTGGSVSLCMGGSSLNLLSECSSSLRYKTNVQTFFGGLNLVRRLRPITFDWRDGGMSDVGFAAEEVNEIEPLLTTRNDRGEIEGVKYGQFTAVLVNAVNEQQTQIERQNGQIEAQQKQLQHQQVLIDGLRKLVCQINPQAEVCREEK